MGDDDEFDTLELALYHPTLWEGELAEDEGITPNIQWKTVARESHEDYEYDEDIYFYLDAETFDKIKRKEIKPGVLVTLDEDFLLAGVDGNDALLNMDEKLLKKTYDAALKYKRNEDISLPKYRNLPDVKGIRLYKSNKKGWHKEPVNHALASKGIKVGKARVKR